MSKMTRTLVTTRYHILEGEWGSAVREHYLTHGFQGSRDIVFHEIQDSTVDTGLDCVESQREARRVAEQGRRDLWIDLHCADWPHEPTKLDYLKYIAGDEERREGLRQRLEAEDFGYPVSFDGYARKHPPKFGPVGIPWVTIETQFQENDFAQRNAEYQRMLEHTCRLINLVHDYHERVS